MLKQSNEHEWKEVYIPIPLCSLNVSVRCFCRKYNMNVFAYEEHGLGPIVASVFEVDGTLFWLKGPDCEDMAAECVFEVRSYEPDTKLALEKLCKEFGLTVSDLSWINNSFGKAKWKLSRFDDNGNEIDMFLLHDEIAANSVKKWYEDKGHKQAYFVSMT